MLGFGSGIHLAHLKRATAQCSPSPQGDSEHAEAAQQRRMRFLRGRGRGRNGGAMTRWNNGGAPLEPSKIVV